MTSGTSVSYTYDAIGRRIGKNVNGTITKYVYSGQDLVEERNGSGSVIAKYVYAGGTDDPVKVIKGGSTYYFQKDALESVTALVDDSGEVFESYTYDAFGKPSMKDASGDPISVSATPFLFTGREYDSETGLYHYRTRAYSPQLGKFLQPDSINFGGGDVNLYRYVENNPINAVDPTGMFRLPNGRNPVVRKLNIAACLKRALDEYNKLADILERDLDACMDYCASLKCPEAVEKCIDGCLSTYFQGLAGASALFAANSLMCLTPIPAGPFSPPPGSQPTVPAPGM